MNDEEIKEILEGIEVVIKHDGTLEFDAKELKILLNYVTKLQSNWNSLREINNEAKEYLTSYEVISTIQGLDDIEKNKQLDEKTMNEMTNRYLKVHDNLLSILDKMNELKGVDNESN